MGCWQFVCRLARMAKVGVQPAPELAHVPDLRSGGPLLGVRARCRRFAVAAFVAETLAVVRLAADQFEARTCNPVRPTVSGGYGFTTTELLKEPEVAGVIAPTFAGQQFDEGNAARLVLQECNYATLRKHMQHALLSP